MTRYLIAALVVALLSVVAAAMVLSGLYGFNPLKLTIVSQAGDVTSVSDQAAIVSAIATASAAVSTVFALIVGTIAVIAVIVAERSETKSIEQLKLDFAALGSTLVSLRDRGFLYTNPDAVDVGLDPFKPERESLARILTSSTGFALYVWSKEPCNKEFADLYSSLAGLIDVTTLDLRKQFQPVANLIIRRSAEILRRLASIDESQFKAMSRKLGRIGAGLRQASVALQRDILDSFEQDFSESQGQAFRPPTEAELTRLQRMAQEKIGGKSAEIIKHFGRAAIQGTPEDRRKFHSLIRQLLGVTLDELGER